MTGINTDYFCELEFGSDFVTNKHMEKFYQTWYIFLSSSIDTH